MVADIQADHAACRAKANSPLRWSILVTLLVAPVPVDWDSIEMAYAACMLSRNYPTHLTIMAYQGLVSAMVRPAGTRDEAATGTDLVACYMAVLGSRECCPRAFYFWQTPAAAPDPVVRRYLDCLTDRGYSAIEYRERT